MTTSDIHHMLTELGPRGRGRRYPAQLRQAAGALARARVDAGGCWTTAAAELGLPLKTVRRWADVEVDARVLVPVVTAPPPAPDTLRVRTPSGVVLEGLDLPSAVAVLRALA